MYKEPRITLDAKQKANMERGWMVLAREGEIDRVPELFRYFRPRGFRSGPDEVYGVVS